MEHYKLSNSLLHINCLNAGKTQTFVVRMNETPTWTCRFDLVFQFELYSWFEVKHKHINICSDTNALSHKHENLAQVEFGLPP